MTKQKIVFFGNERLATGVKTSCPTLSKLVQSGYDIPAVVTNYEKGLSRNARGLEIADIASRHNIELLTPDKPLDITDKLQSYNADIAVLVAYGRIVPQQIIDIFPKGIINIHPSLLPLHRGPTPIESVILDGSSQTGVSLMQLVKDMDAGPVFAHSEISLTGSETKQELADNLLDIGGSMMLELLPGILEGSIVAKPQDHPRATYDSLISKQDGLLNFNLSADELARQIRAYQIWPNSFCSLNGNDLIIKQAHINDLSGKPGEYVATKKSLTVFCGEGSLDILVVQPAGKKEMPIQAFLAGNKL